LRIGGCEAALQTVSRLNGTGTAHVTLLLLCRKLPGAKANKGPELMVLLDQLHIASPFSLNKRFYFTSRYYEDCGGWGNWCSITGTRLIEDVNSLKMALFSIGTARSEYCSCLLYDTVAGILSSSRPIMKILMTDTFTGWMKSRFATAWARNQTMTWKGRCLSIP